MSYKTELHCHSTISSNCGRITPREIVEKYLDAGYTTLVITDHISRDTFQFGNYQGPDDWDSQMDFYLHAYHALREEAKGRLNVLLGAEVRIDRHHATDYLLYGVTEEFLRKNAYLNSYHLADLSRTAREGGVLFVQAHPFRDYMVVTPPALLDGVEVFNGSAKHSPFRGEIADIWAKHYDLIPTSGSDIHRPSSVACGGIETDEPITSNEQLLEVLRSRNYRILRNDDVLTDDRETK
jgi:hypothetical protein